MTALAVRFERVVLWSKVHMFLGGDRDQMFWVDAPRILAAMVKIPALWDITHQDDVSGSMSWYEVAVKKHHPITLAGSMSSPFPAIGLQKPDLKRQANNWRHPSDWFHTYMFCKKASNSLLKAMI